MDFVRTGLSTLMRVVCLEEGGSSQFESTKVFTSLTSEMAEGSDDVDDTYTSCAM